VLPFPRQKTVTLSPASRSARRLLAVAFTVCATIGLVQREAGEGIVAAQLSSASTVDGLEVLEVRPNVFLIAGAGGNIAVQVGDDGVVVVDAGSAVAAPAVVAAISDSANTNFDKTLFHFGAFRLYESFMGNFALDLGGAISNPEYPGKQGFLQSREIDC